MSAEAFRALPPRAGDGLGYAYIVLFSNGTVKVGNTYYPFRRFDAHRRDAQAFGLEVIDWWISPETRHFEALERWLLGESERLNGAPSRREYFQSLDFTSIRNLAAEHTAALPDDDAIEEQRLDRLEAAYHSGAVVTLEKAAELAAVPLSHLKFNIERGLVDHLRQKGRERMMSGPQIVQMILEFSVDECFSHEKFGAESRSYRQAAKNRSREADDDRRRQVAA